MSSWVPPTIAEFKAYFFRDFNYGTTLDTVTDLDIQKALDMALLNFNSSLFGTNAQITMVFYWLAAFYLAYAIQTSTAGVGSQSNFPISSKSAGNVSVSFAVPPKLLEDPNVAIYTMNGYGMKYLSLVLPFTVGVVRVARGGTTVTETGFSGIC